MVIVTLNLSLKNAMTVVVKLSRKRARDKIWMTSGLKSSSRHKNRLYRKWRVTIDQLRMQQIIKSIEDIINK